MRALLGFLAVLGFGLATPGDAHAGVDVSDYIETKADRKPLVKLIGKSPTEQRVASSTSKADRGSKATRGKASKKKASVRARAKRKGRR